MRSSTTNVVQAGLSRGWIEYRQSFTSGQDLFGYFGTSAIFVVIAYFQQDMDLPEASQVSNGALMIVSTLGFLLTIAGLMTVAQVLSTEREDGTLLRAKSIPGGMLGYLVGKCVHILLVTVTNLAIVLAAALVLIDGVRMPGAAGWATAAWVLVLGLLATAPLGAVIGSLISSPRTGPSLLMVPIVGVTMASGVFFPITFLPEWAQILGQVFPVYWLALGFRSVFLPEAMVTAEIGESWRHLETAGVLGAWALVGLVVVPFVLRWMARRESGSRVEAARQRAMQRAM